MNQIKIYDIAGSAGVSLATVSRVLNHPEKVKKATRDKVLRIIKEKGYKPNANARGLASRKSTTVAVIVIPRPHVRSRLVWPPARPPDGAPSAGIGLPDDESCPCRQSFRLWF